ncbi:hypothetical protein [Sedimentitalea sp.]|uniref:hypothetical protein n=1 Tax=Sedimentitalea sp. TaxID=2048915 RepID=UPI0032983D5B
MSSSVSFQPPRRLRVFAFDPGTGNGYANRGIREMSISVPWEMDPKQRDEKFFGPNGEYLQVVDYDPASGVFYEPINLNAPEVLYNEGLSPSAENPKFHQQMVYAVAMDTIALFEQALGRFVLWSPRDFRNSENSAYVGQLRIYPHALREANAFYSPDKKALLFGYFSAGQSSGSALPNTTVFTCLSHDIIVHETCHAILDGMHPRFIESSNPDMRALHEAFSDIVAIFQHFSHPEVLEDQIARTRGDLERQSLLGALAQEFGEALGRGGALRDALGHVVDGEWQLHEPDNRILKRLTGPHARGAVLVAAVFRAFLSIYRGRVADLFRIATNGRGILPDGEIDPDLVKRLASEAAKSARHVLRICIRGMDYVPPVNVDFGDYLRAIVTADHDLYPEDEHNYRRAIIEAFTAWGIAPEGMAVVAENNLLWPELREAAADLGTDVEHLQDTFGKLVSRPERILEDLRTRGNLNDSAGSKVIKNLERIKDRIEDSMQRGMERRLKDSSGLRRDQVLQQNLLAAEFENGREVAHWVRIFYAQLFWGLITQQTSNELMKVIGINLNAAEAPHTIDRSAANGLPRVEVHSVRMARRIGKRGQMESEYVVELIQSRDGYFDPKVQELADKKETAKARKAWLASRPGAKSENFKGDFVYRCGCTLLIDTRSFEIRRVIRTKYRADDDAGLNRLRRYLLQGESGPANAFDSPEDQDGDNAFAALHRHIENGRF